MAKKKKATRQEFYLYTEGAAKRVLHKSQKQELENLKNRSGGDPRYKTGTSRS